MSDLLQPTSFCNAGEILFLNEELSDVDIIIKTGISHWKFPAHAFMLTAQSSAFQSALEEKASGEMVSQIVIDDMSPTTTEYLLCFIYRGIIKAENWCDGIDLLDAAFKYKVDPLVQKCGRFLEDLLSLTNVCYIYEKAAAYSLPILQDKCLKLVLDAGFVVLRSKAFEVLSKECAMDIVASSELNIDSELVVFDALFRWARLECCRTGQKVTEANILSELMPFLQHVCIDDMSDADKGSLPPSVLSCVKPNNRNRIGFTVFASLLSYSKKLEFEENQTCAEFIGDNLSCIRFSIDAPVYLIGLRFIAIASVAPVKVQLTLMKENAPAMPIVIVDLANAIWSESFRINNRKWEWSEILLQQPVQLKAGDIYNIFAVDIETEVQCPRVTLPSDMVQTSSGHINFNIHGEEMWGITSLIFI